MKRIRMLLVALLIAAVAVCGTWYYMQKKAAQELTPDALMVKLENASELTTQKMIYNGVIESESGSVPILTKETFIMTYKAVIRAGFDVSKAEFEVNDDKITVTIPKSEIQEVTIDPDEIKVYNTSLTLIKPDGKEELKDALVEAEADARDKAAESGLLEAADENAEALVKSLYEDVSGDHKVVVKHK